MASKLAMHKALTSRGLNPWDYRSLIIDEVHEVATFMLHNLSGQLVGYQEYRPHVTSKTTNKDRELMRYYTYRNKDHVAIWGLEKLSPINDKLYVVEGTFKASALHRIGLNAVALLTSTPNTDMLNQLAVLPYTLIAVGDNDDAGHKLVSAVGKGGVSPKDLDEMSVSELYLFLLSLN